MKKLLILIVCLLFPSCVVSLSAQGEQYKLAKFTETMLVAPSSITDNGSAISVNSTFLLTKPVWNDLSIAMSQIRPPASLAPTDMPYKGSHVAAFEKNATNVPYFSVQLPHSYKEGTNLEFYIHLAYPDNTAGNSIWYFTYSWANIGDEFPNPTLPPQVTIASPTTTDRHQLAEIVATIDGTGKEISSVILCSIQRLGALGTDTYDNYIYLISGDFYHQIDTIGSRTELVK